MAHIRLDTLTARTFGVSETEAAALIMEGRVWIGETPADKAGTTVSEDTVLTLREKTKKYASRSGHKLERALDEWHIDPSGYTVCDIGASNGGFTDCLLLRGAKRVFAVDVAYGILDWKLRCDERVTVLERTNARYLTAESLGGTRCEMVTADVSFISLKKIFPAMDAVLRPDGCAVTLVKPQFEAPKQALGKNGIVKDPSILPPLFLSLAEAAAQSGLYLQAMTVSPIHGTNGNVEYLAYWGREDRLSPEEKAAIADTVITLSPSC